MANRADPDQTAPIGLPVRKLRIITVLKCFSQFTVMCHDVKNITKDSRQKNNLNHGTTKLVFRFSNKFSNQSAQQSTVKFLNFWTPENFDVIYVKLKQRWQTLGYFVKIE